MSRSLDYGAVIDRQLDRIAGGIEASRRQARHAAWQAREDVRLTAKAARRPRPTARPARSPLPIVPAPVLVRLAGPPAGLADLRVAAARRR